MSLKHFERCILQTPVEKLLTRAMEWDFEIFDFHSRTGEHALLYLSCHLLRSLGLLTSFPHLSLSKFFSFFADIERVRRRSPELFASNTGSVPTRRSVAVWD